MHVGWRSTNSQHELDMRYFAHRKVGRGVVGLLGNDGMHVAAQDCRSGPSSAACYLRPCVGLSGRTGERYGSFHLVSPCIRLGGAKWIRTAGSSMARKRGITKGCWEWRHMIDVRRHELTVDWPLVAERGGSWAWEWWNSGAQERGIRVCSCGPACMLGEGVRLRVARASVNFQGEPPNGPLGLLKVSLITREGCKTEPSNRDWVAEAQQGGRRNIGIMVALGGTGDAAWAENGTAESITPSP